VAALGAARSVDLLSEQAHRFRPDVVAIADASRAAGLAERLPDTVDAAAMSSLSRTAIHDRPIPVRRSRATNLPSAIARGHRLNCY